MTLNLPDNLVYTFSNSTDPHNQRWEDTSMILSPNAERQAQYEVKYRSRFRGM